MSKVVIKAENISKQYRLGLVGTGTIKDDMKRWWYNMRGKEDPFLKIGEANDRSSKGESDYVWSLRDINFEINQGDSVGIIGRNGAGKSTLLKILSQVTQPTTGKIYTKGRIASLLEVGTGFHPEMTGRENIYTNASIFGLTKKEIDARLDDIISFSELGQYIDNPVRTYSSGMYMRLAFSVAINVNADILLIDEILAVGDANFQAKCFNKLREIKANGTTIIIVSHALGQIEEICDKSIWIKDGQIEQEGDPREVDIAYLDYMNQERLSKDEQERARILRIEAEQRRLKKAEEENKEGGNDKRYGSFEARINDVILSCDDGKRTETLETGRKAVIEIDYSVETPVKDVHAR